MRKIVLDSGAAQLGRWRDHQRHLASDFRRVFSKAPGPLQSVAVMTDADNTRSTARLVRAGDLAVAPTAGAGVHALRQCQVLVDRHFLGPPLHVEAGVRAAHFQPAAQRVAQQLAPLRERHRHQFRQQAFVDRGRVRARSHAHHRRVHARRRVEDSGGTSSTDSIS